LPENSGGQIMGFPCWYHFTMVLHAHISPEEWTISLMVAAVQRHLTPWTWSIFSVYA
jgi:hypothetical protein